ncbi:hypothetical protein M758_7G080200 [Ceratodon purpureus]|nr:hypothetical protein M758_7G080200 [Ceratodon purpureus]
MCPVVMPCCSCVCVCEPWATTTTTTGQWGSTADAELLRSPLAHPPLVSMSVLPVDPCCNPPTFPFHIIHMSFWFRFVSSLSSHLSFSLSRLWIRFGDESRLNFADRFWK